MNPGSPAKNGGVRLEITTEDISRLLTQYGDMVLRISYAYLKNQADAEDVSQDVFLKLMDKKPAFHDKTHEKSWLIRTTINMCKNKVGLFWNKNRCAIDAVPEESRWDHYRSDDFVRDAVMSLPEKYRILIHLYYYEGFSTPELAKLTNQREATVRSSLHRARERLKEILKEEYDFE